MADDDVLASEEIRKDDQSVVRVQVKEFKGSYYLDIREWKDKGSYEGPTKKGVNIPFEKATKIGDKVQSVMAEAHEKMDEHVKKTQDEGMKKDMNRLKKIYGSHT